MSQVNIRKFTFNLATATVVLDCFIKHSAKVLSTSSPNSFSSIIAHPNNIKVMDIFKPPLNVKNMKTLDRNAFTKDFTVPCLKFNSCNIDIEDVKPLIKTLLLKLPNLKPVIVGDETKILLKPTKENVWDSFNDNLKNKFKVLNLSKENISDVSITLNYRNWNHSDILRAIIPDHLSIPRSFTRVGHIIHLNLRDEVAEYKNIIGQVLLDKNSNMKTVVNKTNVIDNTYRNFSMELICGENNMVTQGKENGVTYAFDFSKVYWNPRLATEHERVTKEVQPNDVLFDVFCGVGPFAIPCAKKKCIVYANDLNPDSFYWLNKNVKLNKIKREFIKIYNKDGGDFIRNDIKEQLILLAKKSERKVHVTMNLPAAALDFVKFFKNLFRKNEISENELLKVLPKIHVYFFAIGDDYKVAAPEEFDKRTGLKFDEKVMELHFVRNVSPNKEMVKVIFQPTLEFLIATESESSPEEPAAKRACIE